MEQKKKYRGMGGAKSRGKRTVPWGIKLHDCGGQPEYVEGKVASNELAKSDCRRDSQAQSETHAQTESSDSSDELFEQGHTHAAQRRC